MALTDRKMFRTYPIVLGGNQLACMDGIQPSEGLQRIEHKGAGELGPIDFAEAGREPSAQFSTPDLGLLIALSSSILTDVVSLSGGNTDVQWRTGPDVGGLTPVASSAHILSRSPAAALVLNSFRVETNSQQPTIANCTVYMLRNAAGTLPSVYSVASALTARATFADAWGLGEMVVDSVKWGGFQSLEYTSNIQSRAEYEKGIVTPCGRTLTDRKPMFKAMLKNQDILSTHGVGEVKFNSSETIDFYLRHIDEDTGGRTPETGVGNDVHIKISLTEPVLFIDHPGDDGMVPVEVYHREGNTISAVSNATFPV